MMRMWIWTAVVILPLIAAGGLVYAHSAPDEPTSATPTASPCPLQQFVAHLQSMHQQAHNGKNPHCPLQCLLKYLGN